MFLRHMAEGTCYVPNKENWQQRLAVWQIMKVLAWKGKNQFVYLQVLV